MMYRFETSKDDNGIVVLQSLKVSHLSVIPDRFDESPRLKNEMCGLARHLHSWLKQVYFICVAN